MDTLRSAKYRAMMRALERSAMNNHLARHGSTGLSAAQWRHCQMPSCQDAFLVITMDDHEVEEPHARS